MYMYLHAQMGAGAQAGQLAQNPELLAQMMQVSGVVVWVGWGRSEGGDCDLGWVAVTWGVEGGGGLMWATSFPGLA